MKMKPKKRIPTAKAIPVTEAAARHGWRSRLRRTMRVAWVRRPAMAARSARLVR